MQNVESKFILLSVPYAYKIGELFIMKMTLNKTRTQMSIWFK